ncbi:MAG: hypothetical protein LKF41_04360 [Bifidobacterium sp.]|nr:hypothetical protein [Bifidobacterium sp.]MCH4175077.1 hypothetical protein [Bifidobacterium sp.]
MRFGVCRHFEKQYKRMVGTPQSDTINDSGIVTDASHFHSSTVAGHFLGKGGK